MIFSHFEAVRSEIDIVAIAPNNAEVVALCESYDIDPALAVAPFRMAWAGQSDWDEENGEMKGTCILVPDSRCSYSDQRSSYSATRVMLKPCGSGR